ncbi:uncharacterized protein BcabD6B2_09040 [Babesia caballi]|uniref:Uncharacterized protein n=1 Tax=Babesia caballi TaxID=5871 RepID=A0AAV4LS78_BABCB|nr:hypothetical protein, conserved [Babesia caballi]
MGVQKNSLTEWPKNLKEAIDWLALVGGYGQGAHDMKTKLAAAVNSLTDFKTAFKGKFGTVEDPTGLIKNLADNLGSRFMGYASQGGGFNFNDSGIIKHGNKYTTKYKDATSDGSQNDKDMACIFLGSVVITF